MVRSRTLRSETTAEKNLFRTIWAAGLLVLLSGCGSSSDDPPRQNPPPPPPGQEQPPPPAQEEPVAAAPTAVGTALDTAVTQVIGAAGGVLESADGTVRIEVPAGALAADHTLSIQPISNHAHGKIGGAFRLSPEGVSFARPVRLTFHFTPEHVLGTAPQLLRVASQNSGGFWELHEALTLDADAGSVSVDTNHFSDWSLVTGALLSPQSATVRPGETVALSVVLCERVQPDDLLTPLLAECRSSEVIRSLVRNWSVNAVPGGDGNVGTVSVQEDRSAVYTAPAQAPQPNMVAVSTEYTTLQGELVTLVSNIRVQSGLCTPANVGEPCYFNLVEFNGQGLPYGGLPREAWENPETVNSGRLSLWDADGNGEGTWSLRIVWSEARLSGNLEQFEQLAGEFTSEPNGQLRFTIAGSGTAFTGSIQQSAVAIEGYPFTTNNVSVSAQLRFQQQ